MPSDKLTFKGHSGEDLAARFDTPNGPILTTAIFAHCFTCSKDILAAKRISQRLTSAGIAVLRFDFTGLGHSEGEFANTHFSSNVEDLRLAAEFLQKQGNPVSLLVGHSLGGAAVLKVAAQIPSVKAVVTIGAPSDPEHVAANFGCHIDEIREKGEAVVSLTGRGFTIKREFLDDIASAELLPAVAKIKKALLVLHAPMDNTVSIENAAEIFKAAKHPKSFITLDSADHLLTRADEAEYAASVITTWASRYLDLPKPAAPDRRTRRHRARERGRPQRLQARYKRRPQALPAGRRAACVWRHRLGPVTLPIGVFGPWRLHQHDHPHVCTAKKMALGSRQR